MELLNNEDFVCLYDEFSTRLEEHESVECPNN